MTSPSAPTRLTFSVGTVISRSFSIWIRNIIPFTALILIVHVPLVIYIAWYQSIEEPTIAQIMTYTYVTQYATQFLSLIVAGALVYGVFEQLAGNRPGLGKCIGVGLARLGPVIVVGVIVGVIAAAPMVVAGLVNEAFILIGAIPALILYLMFFVAVPSAVVERPGIMGAIRRSVELTRGYKGTLFLILMVVGIIQAIIGGGVGFAFVTAEGDFEPMFDWVLLGVGVIFAGLQATLSAVTYHDLRVVKEGVGVEELQQVFA
ncbi:MAG: hypothetical protein AAGD14_12845 [Planctomycetota bacterium]